MLPRDIEGFDPQTLDAWWTATRCYLFMDPKVLAVLAGDADNHWAPPATDSRGGRRRFIARVRGRLMRSAGCDTSGDALRELECAFQRLIAFMVRHPSVPRRLLSWLMQDEDPGLRRRVRGVVSHYTGRLAWIIGRAREQGLVRDDVDPGSSATYLVRLIQGLALNLGSRQRATLYRDAVGAFAIFRAALVPSPERALAVT